MELCLPMGQLMQTVLLEAPMEEEYLPELQSVQLVVLVKGEYFPAWQWRQSSEELAAISSLYLAIGHAWHVSVTFADE